MSKREIVGFRLSDSEKKQLIKRCKKRGYSTISECVRSLIADLIKDIN